MHKFILELLSEYFRTINESTEIETGRDLPNKRLMIKIKDEIVLAPNFQRHSLKRLATQFGISQTVLRRSFKICFGIAISDFVHEQVMGKGHYLLSASDQSIDDIADELGYEWKVSFEQAFKKFYNISPAALRRGLKS
jgi:AraC-like DNA-binding protein